MTPPTVRLRRGKAKPLWAGHPLVLSGAVDELTGDPSAGEEVVVVDHGGRRIGRGFFAPGARASVRLLGRDPDEPLDEAFFRRRIREALRLRRRIGLPSFSTDVYRLVHGAGDGLSGVVVDLYGETAVLQLSARYAERRRDIFARLLSEEVGVRCAFLRRVRSAEKEEGLTGAEGDLLDEPAPAGLAVRENGIEYVVDVRRGQKTGHFCDHRENRARVGELISRLDAPRVLDAFCGTGGFALAAARAGAGEVLAVDTSARAIEAATRNAERAGAAIRFEKGDLFPYLRALADGGERFDVVILDPPRLATSRRQLRGAQSGLKELNLRALSILNDGGLLVSACCTGVVTESDFEATVRDAAHDAGRDARVLARTGAGSDHPVPIAAPESRYLTCLFISAGRGGALPGGPRG